MFYQRFIAICLLVLYGVPAVAGPHWHHHDSLCTHVGAGESRPSSEGVHSTQCCSHFHGELKEQEQFGALDKPTFVASHSACLVCAFYAQAQSERYEIVRVFCGRLTVAITEIYFSAESIRTVYLQVRGPPVCV